MKYKGVILIIIMLILFVSGCSLIDDFIKVSKPQVTKNKIGLTGFEAQAKQKICAQKQCITALYTVSNKNLLEFVIIGNENIENYLRENGISTRGLTDTINFLEVIRSSNGGIRQLRFLIPKNETDVDDSNINSICKNVNIECSVDIIVQNENTDLNNLIDAGCLFFATVVVIPDYVDVACAIYVLS